LLLVAVVVELTAQVAAVLVVFCTLALTTLLPEHFLYQ
jgi:hypothetical protein